MEKRVKFDFDIFFTNGGSIKGEDFRLDISGDDIGESALADYIVEEMQLLMVGKVNILNKEILIEPHKRKPIDESVAEDSLIDLSHTIEDGLITYKGCRHLIFATISLGNSQNRTMTAIHLFRLEK